jgi:hypothetical protein
MRGSAVMIVLVGLFLGTAAAAATGPGRAGPFRADVSASYTEQGHRISVAGSGVVNAAGSLDARVVFSGLPQTSGLGAHVPFDEKVIGGTLYVRSPLLKGKVPAGKSWVRFDLAKSGAGAAVELDLLQGIDPAQGLPQLLASASAKKLGPATVRGTQTTHYRIDVAKAAAGAAGRALARLEQMTGQKTTPVEVWVDGDGVVRKVAAAQAAGKTAFSVAAVYSDAASARITAPPAGQTFDPAAAEARAKARAKANATNPWAKAATRACRANDLKARATVKQGPGKTLKTQLAFAKAVLPIELDLLHNLRAIKSKPPVGAKHAVDLLGEDVAEMRSVIAAAGNAKLFGSRFDAWFNDHRANTAFHDAGIPACG